MGVLNKVMNGRKILKKLKDNFVTYIQKYQVEPQSIYFRIWYRMI